VETASDSLGELRRASSSEKGKCTFATVIVDIEGKRERERERERRERARARKRAESRIILVVSSLFHPSFIELSRVSFGGRSSNSEETFVSLGTLSAISWARTSFVLGRNPPPNRRSAVD
jgi:hypothetical protein